MRRAINLGLLTALGVAFVVAASLVAEDLATEEAEQAVAPPASETPPPPATATRTTAGEDNANQNNTDEGDATKKTDKPANKPIDPREMAGFVKKGLSWLVKAQHEDGGWGGGSHANQQNRNPHGVPTDPGTTAFTLLALHRAGHTPVAGDHAAEARRGLEHLVKAVEQGPSEGPLITEIKGTQPQTKLGPNVDTSLAAQYLARVLPLLAESDPLRARTDAALDKCLAKLEASQQEDGSWGGRGGGGWAPVLMSSLGCSSLEIAKANGKPVSEEKLSRARAYQKKQVNVSGGRARALTEAAAGVELYAFNSALRGNAVDAREAEQALSDAKASGKIAGNAPADVDTFGAAGFSVRESKRFAGAIAQNVAQLKRLDDESLLKGFGNNGGEEFLSYLMTSESLVIAGADKFHKWNDKMHDRLKKVQNGDGSWSGHHCITSPVFCTAAVVQCLTTDRDAEFLADMANSGRDKKVATAK